MTFKELFRNEEHQYNAWFLLLYVVLVFIFAGLVWKVDERFPSEISLFDFAILSLATFRLVRLFTYDRVTLFIREYFSDTEPSFRRAAGELLACPWCFGVWAGTFAVFFYYVMPMAWFVLLILAISGVGSFIQLIANMIGWRAEKLKIQTGLLSK